MYKIREAQTDDYQAISKLNDTNENMHLHENNATIEEDCYYESLQDVDSKGFLVENSGEIKAFTFFTIDRFNHVIEVKKFTINHSDRKKGLGDHLHKKLEQVAGQSEVTRMQVIISESHIDIIDFFDRNGWVKENRWYVKYISR